MNRPYPGWPPAGSEVMDAARMSSENDPEIIVWLGSDGTEDPFIADLALALGARGIKLGSLTRWKYEKP